ncbi:hypothetical protein [Streptomyces sp. NPDC023588]
MATPPETGVLRGRLRAVGRTVPVRPDASRQVAEHPTAAAAAG